MKKLKGENSNLKSKKFKKKDSQNNRNFLILKEK